MGIPKARNAKYIFRGSKMSTMGTNIKGDEMIDGKWPVWASKYALEISRQTTHWGDEVHDGFMHKADAIEGQRTQSCYPFDAIVLAKFMCEAAQDDRRLFMKYLSDACKELYLDSACKDPKVASPT